MSETLIHCLKNYKKILLIAKTLNILRYLSLRKCLLNITSEILEI